MTGKACVKLADLMLEVRSWNGSELVVTVGLLLKSADCVTKIRPCLGSNRLYSKQKRWSAPFERCRRGMDQCISAYSTTQ
jgi:hypothetical protein